MNNISLFLGTYNIRISFETKVAFNQLFQIYNKTLKKNYYEVY